MAASDSIVAVSQRTADMVLRERMQSSAVITAETAST